MNPREVMAALVILALSSVMDKNVRIDIAYGQDYSVVMDWVILDDGSCELIKETRV